MAEHDFRQMFFAHETVCSKVRGQFFEHRHRVFFGAYQRRLSFVGHHMQKFKFCRGSCAASQDCSSQCRSTTTCAAHRLVGRWRFLLGPMLYENYSEPALSSNLPLPAPRAFPASSHLPLSQGLAESGLGQDRLMLVSMFERLAREAVPQQFASGHPVDELDRKLR